MLAVLLRPTPLSRPVTMATSLMPQLTDLVLHGLGCRLEVRCTGDAADQLAMSMTSAWSWCLDAGITDIGHARLHDAGSIDVTLDDEDDLPVRMMTATQEVTRALITAQAGRLLMFHAGAVSHPDTGATLVYVAPGGTGKTTLSSSMGLRFRYLTDETVGIDSAGRVHPYPKPLSTRPSDGIGPKVEVSPAGLRLRRSGATPHVARVILLDRQSVMTGTPEMDELGFMDALFALVGQTSSLSVLERPLHQLGGLIDSSGPVLRVRYGEAADIEEDLAALIGGMP